MTPKHGMAIILEKEIEDIASDENESGLIDDVDESDKHRPHTPFV